MKGNFGLKTVRTLREGLAEYYHRKEYLRCESMGALIRENLESIRRETGRPPSAFRRQSWAGL